MVFKTIIINALMFLQITLVACSSSPKSEGDQGLADSGHNGLTHPVADVHDSSVYGDVSETMKTFYVKHHKVECEGYWVDQCLLYKTSDGAQWAFLYEDIEGFEFEWGHEYELLVAVQQLRMGGGLPAETLEVYRLVEIVSKTAQSDVSFTFTSRHPSAIFQKTDKGNYQMLDGKSIECSEVDCQSIDLAIEQQQGLSISFRHDENPTNPLHLEAVLCASSLASFSSDCGMGHF
ncbi:MAG: DUF4377 domain-containing protein [Gammaproteobacteria bacterium]|nr:DUF4377 domain-containing protein [Gammaproteobacteria bacterium]